MDVIIVGAICFIAGVICHAAVIAWLDRIRDLAKSKL